MYVYSDDDYYCYYHICVDEGGRWRNFINIILSVSFSDLEYKNNRDIDCFHVSIIIIMDLDISNIHQWILKKRLNSFTRKLIINIHIWYSSFHFDIDSIFIHSHYKFIINWILYANHSLATEYINQSQTWTRIMLCSHTKWSILAHGTWHIWLFTQLPVLAITWII